MRQMATYDLMEAARNTNEWMGRIGARLGLLSCLGAGAASRSSRSCRPGGG
jgi:hypothetical protein